MKTPIIVAGLCLGLALPVQAQMQEDLLSVHPARVRADAPFLLLLQDQWPNGCAGSIASRLEGGRLVVTATVNRGDFCTQAVVPFRQLINPQALAEGLRFEAALEVEYRFDDGNGPLTRASRRIDFVDEGNPAARVETGSWVTPALANSGLFIDQQGEVLTAALLDFDAEGRGSWQYAAGRVNGNVFSAPISSYREISCVSAPCSRAEPDTEGRIDMLLLDHNQLLVSLDGVLQSPQAPRLASYEYQRLDFERSVELVGVCCNPPPDLVGNWMGGMQAAAGRRDDLRTLAIKYRGMDLPTGIDRHIFDVYPTGAGQTGTAASEPLFQIACSDQRPIDGPMACETEGYRFDTVSCSARFAYATIGLEQVRSSASCSDAEGDYDTQFLLYRLD